MTDLSTRFSRAAARYDHSAGVQREVAAQLALYIGDLDLVTAPRILEIGCGTGLFSEFLLPLQPSLFCVSDLSPTMVSTCRDRLGAQSGSLALAMDGGQPCFGESSFDLVTASMSLQWLADPATSLPGLCRLVAPGGYLAFAALASDNFPEWRRALEELGIVIGLRRFPGLDEWRDFLPPGSRITAERRRIRHDTAQDFLGTLKSVGADMPDNGYRPLTPGALRRVMRRFESGITVTYNVVYGVYRRPGSARTP